MISWAGLNCCTSYSPALLSSSCLRMQGKEGADVLVTESRREWCRKHATEFMRICEKNYMAATLSCGSPSVFAVMFKSGWFSKRERLTSEVIDGRWKDDDRIIIIQPGRYFPRREAVRKEYFHACARILKKIRAAKIGETIEIYEFFDPDWFTMRNLVPPYKIAPPLTEEEDKEINWKEKQDFPF